MAVGRRRMAVIAAVVVAMSGSTMALRQAAVAEPATEASSTGLAAWLAERGDDRVQRLAGRVNELAVTLGPDRFGGSRWTENGKLVVQVVGGAEPEAVVRAWESTVDRSAGLVVHIQHVTYTRAYLKSVAADLSSRANTWVDSENNTVVAEVAAREVSTVSTLAADTYGAAVTIREATPATRTATSRRQDDSPFYGALSINSFSTTNPGHPSDCTSGYAWRLWSTGAIVESTAGHCFTRNTAIYNAQSRVGTVTHRAFADEGPTDAEFITPPAGTTFASRVWVGSTNTTVSWPVVGVADDTDAHIGGPIVISGSNGGETRGTVLDTNVRHCFSDGTCTLGMTEFRVVSGGIQGGDSGGPCFSSASGQPNTVVARGQVVGASNNVGPGQIAWCTPVNDISATLQASLVTQ